MIGFERTKSLLSPNNQPNTTFDATIGRFELLFVNYTNSTLLYNRVSLQQCNQDKNYMCVPTDQNLTISGDLNTPGNYSFFVLQYRPCQSYDNITKIMTADEQATWSNYSIYK